MGTVLKMGSGGSFRQQDQRTGLKFWEEIVNWALEVSLKDHKQRGEGCHNLPVLLINKFLLITCFWDLSSLIYELKLMGNWALKQLALLFSSLPVACFFQGKPHELTIKFASITWHIGTRSRSCRVWLRPPASLPNCSPGTWPHWILLSPPAKND